MRELTTKEMIDTRASGLSGGAIAAIIGGVIAFIVGAFDGYTRPYKCR